MVNFEITSRLIILSKIGLNQQRPIFTKTHLSSTEKILVGRKITQNLGVDPRSAFQESSKGFFSLSNLQNDSSTRICEELSH